MAYSRNTGTTLGSIATMILAVDSNGAVKEFVNPDVNANMVVDSGVTVGSQSWSGVQRKHFRHLYGIHFAAGHRPQWNAVTGVGYFQANAYNAGVPHV